MIKNDFVQDLYLVIVVHRRCSFIFDTYTVLVKINKIKFQFVNKITICFSIVFCN